MNRQQDILFVVGLVALVALVLAFGGSIGTLAVLALCAGLAVLMYLLYDPLLLTTLGEVLMAMALLVMPAGLFIWFVILELPEDDYPIGHLIIATGVSVGWVATWFATEYRREKQRRAGQRDLAIALRSEILSAVQTLDVANWDNQHEKFKERINDPVNGGEKYAPVTLSEAPNIIFEQLGSSLELLPQQAVVNVIEYYAAQTDLKALAEDLQNFGGPETETRLRIGLHERITESRRKTLQRGIRAIYELNIVLGLEDPAGNAHLPRSGENPKIGVIKP